jgi:anti-anti-sigma factor
MTIPVFQPKKRLRLEGEMSGEFEVEDCGSFVRVMVYGTLVSSDYQEFLDTCRVCLGLHSVTHVNIDLTHAQYMDKSGLGMLLLVKEAARQAGITMSLSNSSGYVRDLLEAARFAGVFCMYDTPVPAMPYGSSAFRSDIVGPGANLAHAA